MGYLLENIYQKKAFIWKLLPALPGKLGTFSSIKGPVFHSPSIQCPSRVRGGNNQAKDKSVNSGLFLFRRAVSLV